MFSMFLPSMLSRYLVHLVCRAILGMLGSDGYDAIAPDWIGHGDSDKPEGFDCSAEAYIKAMEQFVQAVDIKRPFALVVHVSAARLRFEVGMWIGAGRWCC